MVRIDSFNIIKGGICSFAGFHRSRTSISTVSFLRTGTVHQCITNYFTDERPRRSNRRP